MMDPEELMRLTNQHVLHWANLLGLGNWDIEIVLEKADEEKGEKTGTLMSIAFPAFYKKATLTVTHPSRTEGDPELEYSPKNIEIACIHELLHLVYSPVYNYIRTNFAGPIYDYFNQLEESVVDGLANSLMWARSRAADYVDKTPTSGKTDP